MINPPLYVTMNSIFYMLKQIPVYIIIVLLVTLFFDSIILLIILGIILKTIHIVTCVSQPELASYRGPS